MIYFFVWKNNNWNKVKKGFNWCQPLDSDDYNPAWKNQFSDHSSECHRGCHVGYFDSPKEFKW